MIFNRKQKLVLLIGCLFLVFNYFWMLNKQVIPQDAWDAQVKIVGKGGYSIEEALDDLNSTKIRYRELAKNNFYAGVFVIILLTGAGIGIFSDKKSNK